PLQDEEAESAACPRCGSTLPVAAAFPATAGAAPGPAPERPDGLDPRRYELLERLGAGGMGEGYLSRDPGLGRDLAVKGLRPAPLRARGAPDRLAAAPQHRAGTQPREAARRPALLHDEGGQGQDPRRPPGRPPRPRGGATAGLAGKQRTTLGVCVVCRPRGG